MLRAASFGGLTVGMAALGFVLGCSGAGDLPEATSTTQQAVTVSGELRLYHKVTVDFVGPEQCESEDDTFTDYKLDVKFTAPSGTEIWVPGYFAADGEAVDSGADCGNVWRAHLRPEELGEYAFTAYLKTGPNAHLAYPGDFSGLGDFAGGDFVAGEASGTLGPIADTVAGGVDLRRRGPVHKPAGSLFAIQPGGFPYPILGPGSPEDFLGIADVDGNTGLSTCENNECTGYTQDVFTNYTAHLADYDGSGAWDGGTRGQGTLGALHYLSTHGVTGLYIVINTAADDGDATDTWIYAHSRAEVMDGAGLRSTYWRHLDVSKADQWARIFEEANEKGIVVQLYLHENENRLSDLNDVGSFSFANEERWALIVREFMARFGYLNGMGLNLGEEVGYSGQTNHRMCESIKMLDPYTATGTSHLCLAHTHNNAGDFETKYSVPERADAIDSLDGPAVQGQPGYQVDKCRWLWSNPPLAGKTYFCGVEEPNSAGTDSIPAAHVVMRGAGSWLYFDGGSDNNISDFRNHSSREAHERLGYLAQRVFMDNRLPVADMQPDHDGVVFQGLNTAVADGDDAGTVNSRGSGLFLDGVAYAAYLGDATSVTIDLPAGSYAVRWYDDATQAAVQDDANVSGGVTTFQAPGTRRILVVLLACGGPADCDDNDPCTIDDCTDGVCTYAPSDDPACGSGTGGAVGTGGAAGTGGSNAGTGGSDAGTGGSDAGTGGSDAGTGGSPAATGGANSGAGGVDSTPTPGNQGASDEGGCGCRSTRSRPGSSAIGGILLGLLLLVRRRDRVCN